MKKVILVVEDEKEIRNDIEFILNQNNYKAICAENGKVALKLIENVIPDLIISDIMMPELDGFELLKELQKSELTSTIPFLILTAKIDRTDMRTGMKLGADDFITKPFNFDDLIDAVESRLKKKSISEKKMEEAFEDLKVTIKYSLPHEIRNPINVILGFSDLLKNSPAINGLKDANSRSEILDMLSHINSAGVRLNKMFENYLLMASLDLLSNNQVELNNKLACKTQSTEILLIDISNQLSEKYERQNDIKLELNDAPVFMDNDFFIKICEEIIDNAFKFSKPGKKVIIKSYIENKFLVIEVIDYGRGIKKEYLNRISEYIQFERRLYEQQGIGLGLALSKKIVELHRGIFKVISENETDGSSEQFTKVTMKLPRIV